MKTKKNNFILGLAIFSLLFISFWFLLETKLVKAEAELINDFNANITIQKDGLVFVTEKIIYNFGSNQKRGIFRDIPLTAINGPALNINVLEVKNENGKPYQYNTSFTNNVLHIKIGDPNVLVSGIKTYIISYKVLNAIRTFKDHHELYWNVTGNQWPVAILNASASVNLSDLSVSNVRMDCFTGPLGSTQKNCSFHQDGFNVNYSTTKSLKINEGLTIVLGIPLGYINNTYVSPSQTYSVSQTSNSNPNFVFLFFLIPFIIFILFAVKLFAQRAKLTKPKPVIPHKLKSQPVVVEYHPPDNLSPIEIGTLLDRRVDTTDISSVIIDLAVRGYIKIRYLVQPMRFLPDKKDFELIKLKDGADLVRPADKIIFELLFNGQNSIKLSDLKEQKTSFQSDIERIKKDTENDLYNKGYFDEAAKNKSKKLKAYLSFLAIILFIGLFLSQYFRAGFGLMFIVLLVGVFIIISLMMTKLTHKLTPQGISALGKILGFREFLQLTEKDKLQLLNAPELQPEMFERFLPYAMVLGIEDKWAKKFEGIYNTAPNWYEDPTAVRFNSYALASNLAFFNSSFNQVFNIAFSTSSGFGSGGFSGGGSGGGGGGSW